MLIKFLNNTVELQYSGHYFSRTDSGKNDRENLKTNK